jgi:magnesium chelatase family protein
MRYRSRISGPLLDRIDLHVDVPALSYKELSSLPSTDSSYTIGQRVTKARRLQSERFENQRIYCNSQMNNRQIRSHCELNAESGAMLEKAVDKLGLSARAYFRILKIARTIADMSQSAHIRTEHICEAIQYRTFDRK